MAWGHYRGLLSLLCKNESTDVNNEESFLTLILSFTFPCRVGSQARRPYHPSLLINATLPASTLRGACRSIAVELDVQTRHLLVELPARDHVLPQGLQKHVGAIRIRSP